MVLYVVYHFMFQFQIFTLKARLASAESMTHDVIRDLLGVKLDMTNYAVTYYTSLSRSFH